MKNVLIIGAGISGVGAAHVLLRHNCNVVISDLNNSFQNTEEYQVFKKKGVKFYFGIQTSEQLKGIDTVVVSPSISLENILVREALARNIAVISEIELAFCITKASILAVTGTNGKTTTTKLLGLMLKNSGKKFAVAGNLGVSLSDKADLIDEKSIIAAEVSSFQLEFIKNFKPKAAAILNITPDHLERHHTMEAYVQAKARIFENMNFENCILLNADDKYTNELTEMANKHTNVCLFSIQKNIDNGAFLDGEELVISYKGNKINICNINELQIKGKQNYANALAASFLAFFSGISLEAIREALKEFKGLPHRIEFVRKFKNINYYNDSKATNTDASIKGMEAFDKPVILIAGGHDKGIPLSEYMKKVKEHTKELILIGEATERFEKVAINEGVSNITRAKDMEDAVYKATKFAEAGDIIILSPACSSFDMYKNMAERGNDFKRIVNSMQ